MRIKRMIVFSSLLFCFLPFLKGNTTSTINFCNKKDIRRNAQIENNDAVKNELISEPILSNYVEHYKYYKSDDFGNSFIVADVLNESAYSGNVCEIKLIDNKIQYYDYGNSASLRREDYVVEFLTYENDILLKSFYIPSSNEVGSIINKTIHIDKNDDVYNRLITSMNFENSYKQSLDCISACNSVNIAGLVDNQAPLDLFLKTKDQPESILPTNSNSNIPSSDNAIVNLLGKNIFTSTGTYQKAGAEWGYFAKTAVDKGSNLLTSVLIYDISTIKADSVNPDIVSISPVLTMDYKYNYDNNVVYQYSKNNYCLGNPYYKAGLKYIVLSNNQDTFVPINPGESGYNKDTDNGYCIASNFAQFIGQPKNFGGNIKLTAEIIFSVGNLILGAATSGLSLPAQAIIGGAYTLLSDATLKLIDKLNNQKILLDGTTNNGRIKYSHSDTTGSTDFDNERNRESGFAKYIEIGSPYDSNKSDEENDEAKRNNPLLFKDSLDSISYEFGLFSSEDTNYVAQIAHMFSAEVFNDNTWLFNSKPTYLGTVKAEWSYVFGKKFDSKEIKIESGHKDTVIVFGQNKETVATFTPKKTGAYDILLHDMLPGSTFSIGTVTKTSSCKKITDPWGMSRTVLSKEYLKSYISLTAGTTYRLHFSRILNEKMWFGMARLTIYLSDSSSVSSGDSKNDSNYVYRDITNENGYYIDNQFIPKQDGVYTIVVSPSAQSNSKDTYMSVLDDEYNIIASDDDGWGDRIAGVRIPLVANKAYYIASGFYGTSATGSYRVSICRQTFVPELRGDNLKNEFVLQDFGSTYSSQYLLLSQTNKRSVLMTAFWISNDASGNIDIIIYNDRMEQLVYGSNVGNTPLSYTFTANRLYLIKISTKATLYKGLSVKFQEA